MGQRGENQWMASMSQRIAFLALTARNVSTEREKLVNAVLTQFAGRLDSLAFLLKEMQRDAELRNADYSKLDGGKLAEKVKAMEDFLDSYSDRCILFLICSCPRIVQHIKKFSKTLIHVLESVVQNVGSAPMKVRLAHVKTGFESVTPRFDVKQQFVLDALDPEKLDNADQDPAGCTRLVQSIAESLGMATDSEQFQEQLAKLRGEKESMGAAKGNGQAMCLEQYVAMFEKSKPLAENWHVRPPSVREEILRSNSLNPLQSFICPITREVMRDPVQIDSGQTFEREAIEHWFAKGHTRCPLGTELKTTKMQPNIALRQSIAEWRDRNYEVQIEDAEVHLQSTSIEDQQTAAHELQRMCEDYNMNKYTIASKGLIPLLVRLLETKHDVLRVKLLAALRTLGEENLENQETMVKEGIIDILIRCLARKQEESPQVVHLLHLLSKTPALAERISQAHGAVLLLVTSLGNEHEQTASIVKEILQNLPPSDENIIMMAEANLTKPLVTRLVEGNSASKLVMAKTLAQLHMPETSKLRTGTEECVSALLEMTQSRDENEILSALNALANLTTVTQVCMFVAKGNPSGPKILFPLLQSTSSSVSVRTAACSVMANLMICLGDKWEPTLGEDLQVETLVCNFLSFYFPSTAHAQVLRALLGLVRGNETGPKAQSTLLERDALRLLLPLLQTSAVDGEVRKFALQIFTCLSGVDSQATATALKEDSDSFGNLVSILRSKERGAEVEQLSAMTILANLPQDEAEVTASLLREDCIPVLLKYVSSGQEAMQEEAVGALLRFTNPGASKCGHGKDLQVMLGERGFVQRLVTCLDSSRSLMQQRAAKALTNFSKRSWTLSVPAAPRPWFSCCSARYEFCKIHKGICDAERSFCLKEAGAIPALLVVLRDGQPSAAEAAIEAIMTLMGDDFEAGVKVFAKSNGIPMLTNILSNGTPGSQEMAAALLEKIFTFTEYRVQYGLSLQMYVITLLQKGSQNCKQIAGRILRQLDLLHTQSHYFAQSAQS